MKPTKKYSRRRFLWLAGAGAAGAFTAACAERAMPIETVVSAQAAAPQPTPAPTMDPAMNMGGTAGDPAAPTAQAPAAGSMAGMEMPAGPGRAANPNFTPDVEYNLRAAPGEQAVFPGAKTRVWQYTGELVKGDPSALVSIPSSYLGTALLLRRGQKVRVNFINDLPENSIIHWHGLHVPSEMDGLPEQVVAPGGKYVYEFVADNRAGTYWFHPHPDMRTGFQAYQGLAGLVLISDEEEQALALPAGEFDLPLVIQDRLVDAQNQWIYGANMMDMMQGMLGNRILVNGKAGAELTLAATAYRLRLLNGSNARTYKLAWENNAPWTVIATDAGLLEQPVQRPYLTLSPGERVEVYADFSNLAPGQQVRLVSLPFAGGTMQMMGGMMGGAANTLPNGAAFDVLTVKIDRSGPEPAPLPAKLSTIQRLTPAEAVNAANPRTFTLSMAHMTWLMNGRTYEPGVVAPDEVVKLNTTEAWVFNNAGGMGMGGMRGGRMSGMQGMGGMMNMPHVMHLHGFEFQIIERLVDPQNLPAWNTIKDGLVDEGWKDTFFLMPGEQVKFLVRFTDFTGLYMYHCHIIEHEDMGMMRYFRVDA